MLAQEGEAERNPFELGTEAQGSAKWSPSPQAAAQRQPGLAGHTSVTRRERRARPRGFRQQQRVLRAPKASINSHWSIVSVSEPITMARHGKGSDWPGLEYVPSLSQLKCPGAEQGSDWPGLRRGPFKPPAWNVRWVGSVQTMWTRSVKPASGSSGSPKESRGAVGEDRCGAGTEDGCPHRRTWKNTVYLSLTVWAA